MNFETLRQMPSSLFSIRFFMMFCASILLCSCTALSPLEKASLTEIDKLHAQFQKNRDNPLYHIKLGEEYEKLAKGGASTTYFKKAVISYREALKLDPGNTSLKFSLYQLVYPAFIEGEADFKELTNLYQSVDSGIRKNMNPPNLALFQRKIVRANMGEGTTDEELEQILNRAFEESPFNPQVSYLLSILWIDKERYVLGIDLLKRSLALQPDLPMLNAQLGEAYDAFANKDGCAYEHPAAIRKSLDFLQKAVQKAPDRAHIHHRLAIQYQRLNVPFLTVESARKLVALEPSPLNRSTLAEALSNAGQLEKAEAIYNELLKEGAIEAHLERAMANAEQGNWQLSYEATRRYLERNRHQELPIYSALLYLAVEAILGKEPMPFNELSSHVDISALDPWEKALLDYWYGLSTEDEALGLADNLCKKVELNFMAGVRKLNKTDQEAANHHFQAVLSSKTYSFVEYRVAHQLNRVTSD